MKKDGYYSSGQFARMVRSVTPAIRARFYTDTDFARLQQILLLKYLGFSLEDIREMTIEDPDSHFMLNALNVQLKLVQDWIAKCYIIL